MAEPGVAATKPRVLVIEDGDEYVEFARAFLRDQFEFSQAKSGAAARRVLVADREITGPSVHALLVDLRFERAPSEDLLGSPAELAEQLFGGDEGRARRWIKDQQGALILAMLRAEGFRQRAVFVHDFSPQRLRNLRALHGDVEAVPRFDAKALSLCLLGTQRSDQRSA